MFPDITNKKFINLNNSSTVMVKEQLDDVAILDDGSRMAVSRLLDKNSFDEYIDPNLFFNNPATFDALSNKIKSVPDDILATMKDDDSPAVLYVDPDEERLLLQKRADEMMSGKSVVDAMQSQNEMLGHLLTEDETIDNIIGSIPMPQINKLEDSPVVTEPITHNIQRVHSNVIPEERVIVDDPILTMFKGVKRSVDFETSITINELIPRLDFIEMMEDSYNKSIVEYLADEFTNKILSDPTKIKQLIIDNITSMYKKDSVNVNTDELQKPIPPESQIIQDGKDPVVSKRRGAKKNNDNIK